jgi:hypothetical protein
MKLRPEFIAPNPPILIVSDLPSEAQKVGQAIWNSLFQLNISTNSVVAAVALFHFCRQNQQPQSSERLLYSEWLKVAARDCGMSIRNFGVSLASIRKLIGQVPGWRDLVDVQRLKRAENKFNDSFPFAHKIRHSIAHPEFYGDPAKDMSVRGDDDPNASLGMQNTLVDFTFHATFAGQAVQYDLTEKTIRILLDCLSEIYLAFGKLDPFSQVIPPQ